MNFEVLKRSHLKRNIIIGVVAVLIISAIILNFTRAKYRVTQSIPLVNGTINYTPYDFKMVGIYQENDTGEYVEIDTMPNSGYMINEEKSYCTIDGKNKDENAILKTVNGYHTFYGLQKNSKCYLYFEPIKGLTVQELIARKAVSTRTDFNTTLTEDTTGIIYQANDDNGITYYYAGAPTDNWVYFANFYWRIIRINGDGTIRLIYNGTSTNQVGEDTQISTSAFNLANNDNMYVGFKYTSGSVHGTNTNSNIKNILETWYNSNIQNTEYDKLIVSGAGATFCNDRNVIYGTGLGTRGTNYSAYQRIQTNKTPSLRCENNDDKFNSKIGLITADEVAMAGGVHATNNFNYFLNTNETYWTMTPMYFHSTTAKACVAFVNANGGLNENVAGIYTVTEEYGVRPVINLKADVILSGAGTSADPYVVQT